MEVASETDDKGCTDFTSSDRSRIFEDAKTSPYPEEDTKIQIDALLPEPSGNAKPCIFLELCAGSAKFSAAGIPVVPIDHQHNRHAPRCRIFQLDLSQPCLGSTVVFACQLKRIRRDDNIVSPLGLVWHLKTRAKQQHDNAIQNL